MWVFTTSGFFSAVVDPTSTARRPKLKVRARTRQHLLNLIERHPRLADNVIIETDDSDYRYRIIVPQKVWKVVVAAEAEAIDYGNFKGAVNETAYHNAMVAVWNAMYRLQVYEGKRS